VRLSISTNQKKILKTPQFKKNENHLVGDVLVRLDISGNLLLRSEVITPLLSQSELSEMSPSTKRLDGSGSALQLKGFPTEVVPKW